MPKGTAVLPFRMHFIGFTSLLVIPYKCFFFINSELNIYQGFCNTTTAVGCEFLQ